MDYCVILTTVDGVIHRGNKSECELILKAFTQYNNAKNVDMVKTEEYFPRDVFPQMYEGKYGMSKSEIEKLEQAVFESYKFGSYGEEQLEDYFWNDISELSLDELIEQAECSEDEDVIEIVDKYKTNKAVHKEVLDVD